MRWTPAGPRRAVAAAAAAVLAVAGVACTPTFDWRTVRPEGTAIESLWPCRPAAERRAVRLAGADRPMALHACAAGGVRFALAVVAAGDPAQVAEVAAELRRATASNLGTTAVPVARPWAVRGATANAASGRVTLVGRAADGRPLVAELGLFVTGTTVLQAVAVGDTLPPDVVDTFVASFAVAP